MKNLLFILAMLFVLKSGFADGVAILDVESGSVLPLLESHVNVQVESQVAQVMARLYFRNTTGESQELLYGFPLAETASATGLRWYMNGHWEEAEFSATPPDSVPGGGSSIDPNLAQHLGATPLIFEFDDPLAADSMLIVELSYVQLLDYQFGSVQFHYPSDQSLIQSSLLDIQELSFQLQSPRTIEDIGFISNHSGEIQSNAHSATVHLLEAETLPDEDIVLQYTLSLDELGLFGFSTWLPDSLIPDGGDQGFFLFVAEPEPDTLIQVMDKVFTLIIDRSGSMAYSNKMEQAQAAAEFIVTHLNEGDMFNLVSFSSSVSSFQPAHVQYSPQTEADALNYISSLHAYGSTNISGAFSTAIPQFSVANDSTANIIIFFTDGLPTSGETSTSGILSIIEDLQSQNESAVSIFSFGIGPDVNYQLLTLISAENDGLSEFLENDELEARISEFYRTIRNPVLIDTQLEFTPTSVSEVYPVNLPNLYVGRQMLVSGRFQNPGDVNIQLTGSAFGHPEQYDYPLTLIDSDIGEYRFLTKVWAKMKIEHLLVLYYSLDPDSPEAEELRGEIITLSLMWGVLTPFTSFEDPEYVEDLSPESAEPVTCELLGCYPNPFNNSTIIRFQLNVDWDGVIVIRIYNVAGQLVRSLQIAVNGSGIYEVPWDGQLTDGAYASSGVYIYVLDFQNSLLAGRMTMLK